MVVVCGVLHFARSYVDERYVEFRQSLATIQDALNHHTQLLESQGMSTGQNKVCVPSVPEASDTTTDTPTPVGGPLSEFLDLTIREYDNLVSDVVRSQLESWVFLPAYDNVDESQMNSCPRVSPKVRNVPVDLPHEELIEFVWDDENDIEHYLRRLYYYCSRNAVGASNFSSKCWGLLEDLVYRPRCTTRFDSTVNCTRWNSPYETKNGFRTTEEVLEGHFTPETLNVAIIGAGPTGLFLANALTELNNLEKSTWRPDVRVTIIENRLVASHVKQAYVRSWQTIPHLVSTAEPLDVRLKRLFILLTDVNFFTLPLNALETLLLLSCRDMGIKLLYGNLTDYTDYLSQQPNLLVFDSTGHRLNGLVRGDNCPLPRPVPGIEQGEDSDEVVSTWVPDEQLQEWYYLTKDQYDILNEWDFVGKIATKGDVMYPIGNDGLPTANWWLHIHELPYSIDDYDIGDFWGPKSSNTVLCRACQTYTPESIEDELASACAEFCPKNYFFDAVCWFREDIQQNVLEDPFSVWFALRAASVALSAPEVVRFQALIEERGYTNHPIGMPMDLLPFDEMEKDPVFQQGQLLDGLKELSKVTTPDGRPPKVAVFQHRPYVYHNGHIESDLFGPNTPVLRIGDSLATGDPNRGSGFILHVWMVRNLLCQMRGAGKNCFKTGGHDDNVNTIDD